MEEEKIPNPCNWKEISNNPDWFYIGCIDRKVNIWKQCKKRHITPIQLFLSCPYCKGKVILGEKK